MADSWQKKSREEVKRLLEEKKVLLLAAKEAALKGLNPQCCGVLVNFDLPWNPMKVEQRMWRGWRG
jgi:hypothetical protein